MSLTTMIGGLRVSALSLQGTADLMIEAAVTRGRPGRPLFHTSVNGEVASLAARDARFARILQGADLVSVDSQPLVLLSHFCSEHRFAERVATTDLFPQVARAAAARGVTFYLFGATEEENRKATRNVQRRYPDLKIVGSAHGYLQGQELIAKIEEINALGPDILWLGLGAPREQMFAHQYAPMLRNVAVIKTAGGLFNFLSGTRTRAPRIVQQLGLEWFWRLAQEPRRLFYRYFLTNPHALYLCLKHRRTSSDVSLP